MNQIQQLLKLLPLLSGMATVAPPAARQARKGRKAKGNGRVKLTDEQKALYSAANDAECIKVFTAAGYQDVQPRINVKTYGGGRTPGWLEAGRKVKRGQKAYSVNGAKVFHFDQTEALGDVQIAV